MSDTRPPRFKPNHQCRSCGYWSEGDWNTAPKGHDGDEQRAKAQREMDRGCCDDCWVTEETP